MLNVPFLLNYSKEIKKRVGIWPWRHSISDVWEEDGLVSGKMDFEERMLRFQVCEWKYEFAQLHRISHSVKPMVNIEEGS